MHTVRISREEYENQSGLDFLSESIALLEILGAAVTGNLELDTPQARQGLAIMMQHISDVLHKAELKLSEPY